MSLKEFDSLNSELKDVTRELAYHVLGDPLVLSNLKEYLDISEKYKLKVNLTTAANRFSEDDFAKLNHKIVRQINFSINAYNHNSFKISLEEYLKPIFEFCKYSKEKGADYFINLRIWNLDNDETSKEFNKKVFDLAKKYFNISFDLNEVYVARPKNLRIQRKTFFHFDEYFEWPSLESDLVSKEGFCYGLDSHFGVLANGDIIPCCLDKDAIMKLGNCFEKPLIDILNGDRAKAIKDGFKNNILVEELCQKCSYRTRFD